MSDGYTIEEAASALGVPSARVWELIARGVLSGAQEGGDMRVFLQPRPAPVNVSPPEPRQNGNGGPRDAGEGSPFRELLTEFRNLTERYGQALLALGEARGEVASLRSRVDLLEARVELRLPTAAPPLPWTAPEPPMADVTAATEDVAEVDDTSPVAEVLMAEAEHEAAVAAAGLAAMATADGGDAGPPSAADEAARRRRARRRSKKGAHPASDEIAEALARAEDPSMGELPSGPDAGDALGEFEDALAHPRGLTGEAIEEAPTVSVDPPAVEVAALEPESGTPAPHVEPMESRVMPSGEDEGELEPAVSFAPVEPMPSEAAMGDTEDDGDWADLEEGDDAVSVDDADAPPDQPAPPLPAYEPLPADAPYTASVDEPDWFSDSDLGTWSAPTAETGDAVGVPIEPERGAPAPAAKGGRRAQEPRAAVRRVSTVELPGAGDLREALAALDSLRPRDTRSPARAPAPTWNEPRVPLDRPAAPQAGPAGRAYQRLRRLFPG